MASTMMSDYPTNVAMHVAERPCPTARPSLGGHVERVVDMLFLWRERVEQRRFLAALNEGVLKDLGVGRAEAEAETGKPFWRC